MTYFRKHYHPPGTAPGTLVEHRDAERHPLRIRLFAYTQSAIEEHDNIVVADCQSYLERTFVIWIHIQGHADLQTLQQLAELFDLHALAVEDVVNVGQRPKLELYDSQFFVTLSLPRLGEAHIESEQVSLFMGEGYVVSFHAGALDPFEPVRERLRRHKSRIRSLGADYLLYALMDSVIDQGFPILERIGEQLEELEVELLNEPTKETLNRIHRNKRDLLLLRRTLWPQRELINLLLRDESVLIQAETKLYLRDCYDHSIQIIDLLEVYRDMTAGMLDVYLSSISHRLNEIMRVLTIISTTFIPLTFVVGIYGMNFGRDEPRSQWAMPELDWYYGYPLVWLVLINIAIGMVVYFKRKGWF